MIAPIRYPALPSKSATTGPRHISGLLSAVLARYGIVITEEELAALSPNVSKPSMGRSSRIVSPLRHSNRPARSLHRSQPSATATARHSPVQLALFPSAELATATH